MALEIGCGLAFESLALFRDGIHLSTQAGALAIAALACTPARWPRGRSLAHLLIWANSEDGFSLHASERLTVQSVRTRTP